MENSQRVETKYAQSVTSLISKYDVTLIFHQGIPVKQNEEDPNSYIPKQEEIAKIIISHETFKEVYDLIHNQILELTEKK